MQHDPLPIRTNSGLKHEVFSLVQFSYSVMSDSATPGFPIHHQLPEFTQILVHWVSDNIQPSHVLSSPSPPAFNLSQHQGLLHIRWPKYWSFSFSISLWFASAACFPMNIQDWFPVGWTGWISLQSKGFSSVFSNTTVQKHQFFSTQLSL